MTISTAPYSTNTPTATWIIGSSSGIGYELAKAYVEKGTRVIISSRRAEALNDFKEQHHLNQHNHICVLPLDMTDSCQKTKEHWSSQIQAALTSWQCNLDQVIVNAGTCEYLDSYTIDTECVRRVMETNFFGPLNIINAALPFLRQANDSINKPQLAIMSSSVTYQALPRAGAYGGSKAALRYFAESIKLDLQNEGIDVRVISPGFVKTPLTDLNDFPMPARITAKEAADRIISGLQKKGFDVSFPKRFIWPLKVIAALPEIIKYKLLNRLSRHEASTSNVMDSH